MVALGGLSALLLVIALILYILGMISPKLVVRWGAPEARTRKKVARVYGIAAAALLLLMVVGMDTGLSKPGGESSGGPMTRTPEPTKSDTQPTATPPEKLFTDCEFDLLFFAQQPTALNERAKHLAVAYESGQASALAAYEAALAAAQANKEARSRLAGKLEIPKRLPGPVRDDLRQAGDEFILSCGVKADGWQALAAYLDEKKPSQLQNAKANFNDSNRYFLNGTMAIASAREKMGLRSVRAIQTSPEYKAWRAYGTDYTELIAEAGRLHGVNPRDNLKAGVVLDIAEPVLLAPFPMNDRVPSTIGSNIQQAVKLQPGDRVEILDRRADDKGRVSWYLAQTAKDKRGYINPAALGWIDSREHLEALAAKVAAWKKDRLAALMKRHYQDQGLDQDEVDRLASAERWGVIARLYPTGKP